MNFGNLVNHEIAERYPLLFNLFPTLKSGARVGIVDAFTC
jgi:hypothetical protein